MIVEWVQQCKSCEGTGLYVGMAERDGGAVVCHSCKGTGRQHMRVEYEEFKGRRKHPTATHVYYVNPGVVADCGRVVPGGVPYRGWEEDPESVKAVGREMRAHTCPAWWYQSADYDRKPDFEWCRPCGMFSRCEHFQNKAECWERWDKEFGVPQGANSEPCWEVATDDY